ncbi:MAG: hypothetical protein EU529_05225 [Promethearchaeota archaeon]|nr:MAG: hypothetical protein EU529_05225 [Candidatus Lokiarchaeota archaeon]
MKKNIISDFLNKIKTFRDRKQFLEEIEKEESSSIDNILVKFVLDKNRALAKEKFTQTAELIAKTQDEIEKEVKSKTLFGLFDKVREVSEDQFQYNFKEKRQIKKAGKQFDTFVDRLDSAMPATEEERLSDMKELKAAITLLESYDEESYRVSPKKTDAGVGMFYDRMSRQFKSLISEHKLDHYRLIPIQRLKYHVLSNNKRLKDEDILPIVNIMKETNLVGDVIEVNPTLHVIVLGDEQFDFSLAEKVLLTFAYDEDLTFRKLLELTEWKEEHANNVIKSLTDQGLDTRFDDRIAVRGFGKIEDRKVWNDTIEKIIQEAKDKELDKKKRQIERKEKLKQKLSQVEKMEIPSAEVKDMTSEKQKLQEEQEIMDKDALLGAMEALDDIVPVKADKGLISDPQILENQISENVLEYHEKFSLINGGIAQYEKIKEYLTQELGDFSDEVLKTVLNQLIEFKMIVETIKIGEYDFYLFNEIDLTESQIEFLNFAIGKETMKKEDFINGLEWNEEKTLLTMKQLQQKGILVLAQQNILIPGVIQKD